MSCFHTRSQQPLFQPLTDFNLSPGVPGHVFYLLHVSHRFSGKRAVLAFVDLAAPIAVRQHLRKTVVVWMEGTARVDMSCAILCIFFFKLQIHVSGIDCFWNVGMLTTDLFLFITLPSVVYSLLVQIDHHEAQVAQVRMVQLFFNVFHII